MEGITMSTGMCFGRFDIVHKGHLNWFSWCKFHVDKLYIGVASNDYCQQRNLSVVNSCEERIAVVRALWFGDEVFEYNSHDPFELWKRHGRTDYIFLNSELKLSCEYREPLNNLRAKKVRILWPPRTPGVSVSRIKERIRNERN